MKKPKVASDWKNSWRWFSLQAMILAGALQIVYGSLEDRQKESLAPWTRKITILILALGVSGRFIQQYPECENCRQNDKNKNGES